VNDARRRPRLAGGVVLLGILGLWAAIGDGVDPVSAALSSLTAALLLVGAVNDVQERTWYSAAFAVVLSVLALTLAFRGTYVPAVIIGLFVLDQVWVTVQRVRDRRSTAV